MNGTLWWTNISNRRYLWCHGWTSWTCSCQWQETRSTILGLTTWTSKQKPRIDLFIRFSVGMIHVATDYLSKSQGVLVMSPTRSLFVSNAVSCHFRQFFFPELSWPFRKVQLELFVKTLGRAKKKIPRNGGEILHYCCRNSLYNKNYHLLGSLLKFLAQNVVVVEIWAFLGGHDLLVDVNLFKPVANSTTKYFVTRFTPKMMRFPQTKWSSWKGGHTGCYPTHVA